MPFFRFHVDKLSSAHVYLRMHRFQTMDMITPELLEDCAQLVKANSIQGLWWLLCKNCDIHRFSRSLSWEDFVDKSLLGQWEWSWWKCRWDVSVGNKLNNLDVVYTPWYNLRKTQSMDVGQVGFHNPKLVRILDPVVVAPFWEHLKKRRPVAFVLG